jgi:chromosome segregation ATPase
MLGGNAIVVGVASIVPGESEVSKATLQLLQTMSRVMHFPVGESQQGLSLRGLLRKYRYLILCLEDELKGNVAAASGQDTGLTKRLQDVEQQLLQAKLERNGAIEDSAQIYQMMELLKAKYKAVMSEKGAQAKKLIESEEGRLTVSKSLLEVKLEKTQILEQAEKEKHELTTQLLAAKNEIFELEAELHQTKTQLADTEARAKEAEETVEALSTELQSLKGAHAEVREQLRREEERNAELGAELLTAVNQVSALHSS